MLIQTWGEVFTTSLQALWVGFISFVPNLIIAIIIFIIGWVIASVVDKAIRQVMNAIKIDRFFQSAGLERVFNKAGWNFSTGAIIGTIVKWFIIVLFLITALDLLKLTQVTQFLREVVLNYLPQVIVAALILIVATVVADFIRKLVTGSAKAANVHSARMLGSISYYAIWIFALIIALSQLGVAPQFMQILFTGIIAMLAIAGGLAFGLGGKEAAARGIEKVRGDMSSRE